VFGTELLLKPTVCLLQQVKRFGQLANRVVCRGEAVHCSQSSRVVGAKLLLRCVESLFRQADRVRKVPGIEVRRGKLLERVERIRVIGPEPLHARLVSPV
jgi:hypothetical protein